MGLEAIEVLYYLGGLLLQSIFIRSLGVIVYIRGVSSLDILFFEYSSFIILDLPSSSKSNSKYYLFFSSTTLEKSYICDNDLSKSC